MSLTDALQILFWLAVALIDRLLGCSRLLARPVGNHAARRGRSAAYGRAGRSLWRDPGIDFSGGSGSRTVRIEGRPGAAIPLCRRARHRFAALRVGSRCGRHEWRVKWGHEVHTEVFGTRLAWALGYFAEPTYFVASGTIEGARDLRRAKACIDEQHRFTDARFELSEPGVEQAFRRARLGLARQPVRRHARAERLEDPDDADVELGQQGCPRRRARIEHRHLRVSPEPRSRSAKRAT